MPTEQEYRDAYERIHRRLMGISRKLKRTSRDMALLGQGINFGGFAGVSEFIPSGSPVAWYAADKESFSDDDTVGQFTDQTGNGNHLIQTTEANKPIYKTGLIGGKPALRFDGINDTMKASFTLTAPATIFIVFNQVTWVNNDYIFDGVTSNFSMIIFQDAVTPDIKMTGGGTAVLDINQASLGSFAQYYLLFNTVNSKGRLNGGNEVTGNSGNATNFGGFVLGSNSTQTGKWSNIEVAEVIIYDSEESSTENEAGLAEKYGL